MHPLISGNPAIDAGSNVFIGTTDQIGTIRDTPDVGAVEAVAGLVSGRLFVDLNGNQSLDPGGTRNRERRDLGKSIVRWQPIGCKFERRS